MSDKIGYVRDECTMCGESYNGYKTHTCPMPLNEATAGLIMAAREWAKQFNMIPVRALESQLWTWIADYERAMKVEPFRKESVALLAALKTAGTKTGRLSCRKPNKSNFTRQTFVCDTTPKRRRSTRGKR